MFYFQTENCSRFWFQPTKYQQNIRDIHEELNNPNNYLEPIQNACDVLVGQILAAFYQNDGEFCRAKVLSISREKESKQVTFEVSLQFSDETDFVDSFDMYLPIISGNLPRSIN